ncbi:unnamed protein product, partial [marine sediment metagenome]
MKKIAILLILLPALVFGAEYTVLSSKTERVNKRKYVVNYIVHEYSLVDRIHDIDG